MRPGPETLKYIRSWDRAWPAQWDKRAVGLTPRPDVEALGPCGAPRGQTPKLIWAQTLKSVSSYDTAGQERPIVYATSARPSVGRSGRI